MKKQHFFGRYIRGIQGGLRALAALTLTAFVGCGGEKGNTVLIVGTEPTYPPFEMTNDEGEIIGLDIDLLKAIAADQGFEIEFRSMSFDALVPALQVGNIDIAASGMSITPARQEQVAFSLPYIEAGLVVAVSGINTTVKGVEDLVGLKVAVQQGSTGAAKAEALKQAGQIGEVKFFPNVAIAMLELLNGGVDAVINDKPVTEAYMAKQPGKIKIVGETLVSDQYGFAVAKSNRELLAKINAGLEKLKASGYLDTLKESYFKD